MFKKVPGSNFQVRVFGGLGDLDELYSMERAMVFCATPDGVGCHIVRAAASRIINATPKSRGAPFFK
jgi:hypothetical protein